MPAGAVMTLCDRLSTLVLALETALAALHSMLHHVDHSATRAVVRSTSQLT